MRFAMLTALIGAMAPMAAADGIDDLRWQARPVIVFSDTRDRPELVEQMRLFESARAAFEERKVQVIVDTDPGSALRMRFRPSTFTVILVGLDGGEKFRQDGVVQPETLNALIDGMPMRRREMREDGAGGTSG